MPIADFSWGIFFSPFGIPIAAIVCVFIWLSIVSISEAVTKVMKNRTDADLKLELLSRGLSADEIVRIVEAGRELDEGTQAYSQVGSAVRV